MAKHSNPGLSRDFYKFQRLSGFSANHLSIITLFLIFSAVCFYNLQNKDWDKPGRLIKDDIHFYYIYTSAAVVHHDLRFGRIYNKIPGYARRELWLPTNKDTGRAYSKMSMGMALIYAPFTAIAHYVLVPLTGAEPDGYSPPYKMGLLLSAMLFFLFGLWNLRKVLLEHFNESVTALTLIVIALGTNLSWYTTSEASMSHVYSFALIIYFYRLLQRWFANPKTGLTILMGLVFGLIVLIRPTNLMFIALFFAASDFRERIRFLLRNYSKILLMMIMFVIIWIPQFAFWKFVSGNWFFYTYDKESFFWNNPQIFNSLFSFRKGWLLYTPLMSITFIGLPVLWKHYRQIFWQVTSILALLIFINSSWWCWWFGGSYGNRAYIDGYGIFALSIAALFKAIADRKSHLLSYAGLIILAAFTFLNLFQTWQYRMGFIHYVAMTQESYCSNFMKSNIGDGYEGSLVMPDHEAGIFGIYYPKTEMTFSHKKQLKTNIETNRQHFLHYYKTLASRDITLQKKLRNQQSEQERDSLKTVWAEEQLNMLLKRLF